MGDSKVKKIIIDKNGPYIISGDIPLTVEIISNNKDGFSWDWKQGKKFETKSEYYLCRCGNSKNKPFCDGTHAKINFDGKETASREPYAKQAQTMDGPTLQLGDQENLCDDLIFNNGAGAYFERLAESNADDQPGGGRPGIGRPPIEQWRPGITP